VEVDDVLTSNNVWFGLDAHGGASRVDTFNIKHIPRTGPITVVDRSTTKVEQCPVGLQSLASKKRPGFLIGTAVALNPLVSDQTYTALLAGNFGSLTPENAGKPQFLQPKEGIFTFNELDDIVDFSRRQEMKVHGHALLPNRSFPQWMNELQTDTATDKRRVRDVMENHLATVASHYPPHKIHAWDVFNEILGHYTDKWRDTLWYRAMGEKVFEIGLQVVRDVNPNIQTWINDYGMDKYDPANPIDEVRFQAVFRLAQRLADKGLLDGIGFEGHVYEIPRDLMNPEWLGKRIDRLAVEGLKARVSEMDVTMRAGAARQAEHFVEVLREIITKPNVTDFTVWGIGGPYSSTASLNGDNFSYSSNLLWDEHLKPRESYWALQNLLRHK
ncbi:MAG: glycosyl hydrolase, partial [Candidatus Saccharibacteria bacterium]|nr:glycosyl hydrolase [Candidatus Saccharibacteria bacterium]